ncbi:MAG: fasciclin domain-containing protein [Bacteroidaceae bacterium]|nr:fasciclin domain-containing protein [Bacteroidaceae bacterium]
MENSILKRRLAHAAGTASAALLLLGSGWVVSSCTDDLLTGTPSWLGSSIYEELQHRGNFTVTLELIDDPDVSTYNQSTHMTDYAQILRRTGSMTLFVADDDAWHTYLQRRGVSSVRDLPKSEKKNLLKASMVNSAYLIELLSNRPGDPPVEGSIMRRTSRVDVSDSIPIMIADSFPKMNPYRVDNSGNVIDYWAAVRGLDTIRIWKDNYAAPMVHFLPEFMTVNDITSVDLLALTNGEASDVSSTSYVNGHRVVEQDITCQNGYIHVVDAVPEQLDNMAEILRHKPQFSTFRKLLDRFSYPYPLYTDVENPENDIYVLRYFNDGYSSHALNTVQETMQPVSAVLSIDPGWNTYRINSGSADRTFEADGAALFVPTNQWMDNYLHKAGSAIGEKYGYDWDRVPDDIVLPFLNNCIQASFTATTPSKFGSLKNTASETMGIVPTDVDSCFMACNGVIYQLNKVFVAPAHKSVLFPAMLRADEGPEAATSVIYRTISDTRYNQGTNANWTLYEYQAYVNSMASSYSFLIPKDKAFATYIDPYSVYNKKPLAYKFYIDNDGPTSRTHPVSAYAYQVDTTGGKWVVTDNLASSSDQPTANSASGLGLISNRLEDILNNIVVVHGSRGATTFHDGQQIYLNKAGGPIMVRFEGGKVTGVAGSAHAEKGLWIPVSPDLTFNMGSEGNGDSYILDSIPTTTFTSPVKLLQDTLTHPEFTNFTNLLGGCSFIAQTVGGHPTMDFAISLLGNYHYTIYAPKNSAIQDLYLDLDGSGKPKKPYLPTWELIDEWVALTDSLSEYEKDCEKNNVAISADRQHEIDSLVQLSTDCQKEIENVIDNFVRYHIQDGSVYINGADTVGIFETATIDPDLNRFYRVNVSNIAGNYTVRDNTNQTAHVLTNTNDYNLMARQYLFTTSSKSIYSSSYVVVHLIDRALLYSNEQLLPVDYPQPNRPDWLETWITSRASIRQRR